MALPRRNRRELYIRLRGKILRDAPLYGGLFTSHLELDESRPTLYNQWFDVYFLGSDGHTIWNAAITTATLAFWGAVRHIAYDRTASLLTPEELKTRRNFRYLLQKPYPKYNELGGLTFQEYQEKINREIVRSEPPAVYESFKIDTSYRYGIGLHMVIDAGSIDRVTIEEAIRRFYALGEKDWQSSQPVPRENLPFQSEREALAKVDYPSVLLGQAVRSSEEDTKHIKKKKSAKKG